MTKRFYIDEQSIRSWLDRHGIKNYIINTGYTDKEQYTVDVMGHVDLMRMGLDFIPVKFNRVSGYFNCSYNQLKSLSFAPVKVNGSFFCSHNNLKNLNGAPKIIGKTFDCSFNKLTSLKGGPKMVGENYYCQKNQLISLSGCVKEIRGQMDFSNNNLESLNHVPMYAKKIFGNWNFILNFTHNPMLQDFQKISSVEELVEKIEEIIERNKAYLISKKIEEALPHNNKVQVKHKI